MRRFIIILLLVTTGGLAIADGFGDELRSEFGRLALKPLNHLLFVIPPLVWSFAFANKLSFTHFPGQAPVWLLALENLLRGVSMFMPLFLPIHTEHALFTPGLVTYGIGLATYIGTWSFMMLRPESKITHSLTFQFAPSATPLTWFAGIAMMSDSWLYGAVSAAFIGFHVAEYVEKHDSRQHTFPKL